jgi:hypothetical protein
MTRCGGGSSSCAGSCWARPEGAEEEINWPVTGVRELPTSSTAGRTTGGVEVRGSGWLLPEAHPSHPAA